MATMIIMRANLNIEHCFLDRVQFYYHQSADPIFPWSSKKHNRSKASCPDWFILFFRNFLFEYFNSNKQKTCRMSNYRRPNSRRVSQGKKKDNEEYLRTRCRSFFSSLSITSIRFPVPLPVSELFGRKTGSVCVLWILRNRMCIVLIFLLLLFLFFVPIYYNTGRYVGRNLYGKDFACGK